uniref:Secreted RxLR effector peptide protein n=1 Tax=Steinernema glaseri TaxID=37863 RepID=A0A1I7ZKK6_9BILA
MLCFAVASLLLVVTISAAPLVVEKDVRTPPVRKPRELFVQKFEKPERLEPMGDIIPVLHLLMKPGFSDFVNSLTGEDKQTVKLFMSGDLLFVRSQRHALGTEAKGYLNETAHYMHNRVGSKKFLKETPILLARYSSLSTEAKMDLHKNFYKHTKLIELYALYLKAGCFRRSWDPEKIKVPKQASEDDVLQLFKRKQFNGGLELQRWFNGGSELQFQEDALELVALVRFLAHIKILVKHPNIFDLFHNLTDVDKRVIEDYMTSKNFQMKTTAYSDDLSPAVKKLYQEIHNAIDIPSFVDPTSKKFAVQGHKIIRNYEALSFEDKAKFQGTFPTVTRHIDALRLYFKLDSFLDSSPYHQQEMKSNSKVKCVFDS